MPSSRGYRYLMVFYDVDSNAILVRPVKTKASTELNIQLTSMILHLTKRGFKPLYYVLDNEISNLLKTTLSDLDITYHLYRVLNITYHFYIALDFIDQLYRVLYTTDHPCRALDIRDPLSRVQDITDPL